MNSELYKRVPALELKAEKVEEVDGLKVGALNLPFNFESGAFRQASINPDDYKDLVLTNGYKLIQPTRSHIRSYELNIGDSEGVFFKDEFGNLFYTMSIKGNNLTSPAISPLDIAPSGYIFFGLQDTFAISRVLRASRILRAANVDTELIMSIYEPLELPYQGSFIGVDEYKNRLAQRVWEQTEEGVNILPNTEYKPATRAHFEKVIKALEDTNFYITVRGLQVSERIMDLIYLSDKEDFLIMMKKVLSFINFRERLKGSKDPSYEPLHFDPENDQDTYKYLTDYLPRTVAVNFAKMHKAGIAHCYPWLGNVSLSGSFYDLDSAKGEPLDLGEKPITNIDMRADIEYFLTKGGSREAGTLGLFVGLEKAKIIENGLDLDGKFTESFYRAYMKERFGSATLENIASIVELFNELRDYEIYQMLSDYLKEVGIDVSQMADELIFTKAEFAKLYQSYQTQIFNMMDLIYTQEDLDEESRDRFLASNTKGGFPENVRTRAFREAVLTVADRRIADLLSKTFTELGIKLTGDEKATLEWAIVRVFCEELYEILDQEYTINFEKESTNLYKKMLDPTVYSSEQIDKIRNYIQEKGDPKIKEFLFASQNIQFYQGVPIAYFLDAINNIGEAVTFFTGLSERSFRLPINYNQTGPRVVFTDGQITELSRDYPGFGFKYQDVSYYGFIGRSKEKKHDPNNLYIQTTLSQKEVKDLLSQLGLENMRVRFRHQIKTLVEEES